MRMNVHTTHRDIKKKIRVQSLNWFPPERTGRKIIVVVSHH